ncbi:MAG TPA: methyltransferase domain-containing protein [Verrucomicrobiales bacterium]|nr:methyltransferase domain-containing protein [Verrucomicrobiales bacterium]
MTTRAEWNERYAEGDVPWDKGEAAPPLREWLAENRFEGKVLVPGAGAGHDAGLIAERCPDAEVIGLDIAPLAVAQAASRYRLVNLRFLEGDLFTWPGNGAGPFHWVVEHTCFCAIDPARRDEYAGAVARLLAPRGRLWAVFYLDPYDDEHVPGGGPPHGATTAELDAHFNPAFTTSAEWIPGAAYAGREGRELVRVLEKRD